MVFWKHDAKVKYENELKKQETMVWKTLPSVLHCSQKDHLC